jgi:hypothetical protein
MIKIKDDTGKVKFVVEDEATEPTAVESIEPSESEKKKASEDKEDK